MDGESLVFDGLAYHTKTYLRGAITYEAWEPWATHLAEFMTSDFAMLVRSLIQNKQLSEKQVKAKLSKALEKVDNG